MDPQDRIFVLDKISHSKLNELDPQKTVVVVSVSPIEAHGPHLPAGQDLFEAEALSRAVAEKALTKFTDWSALLLPPIPVGCDTLPHLGSINYPAPLVRDVAYHALKPFAERGFARLGISSFHGGPRHFCALEDAADGISKKFKIPAMSFFSAVAKKMTEGNFFFNAVENSPDRKVSLEQVEMDLHAGMIETSIALHLWPELVDSGWDELQSSVPVGGGGNPHNELLFKENKFDIMSKLQTLGSAVKSLGSAIDHYKKNTYLGYPQLASAEQGKLLFDHLVDIASGFVEEFIERGLDMDVHSPVWGFKDVLLNPAVNTVLDDWLHLL